MRMIGIAFVAALILTLSGAAFAAGLDNQDSFISQCKSSGGKNCSPSSQDSLCGIFSGIYGQPFPNRAACVEGCRGYTKDEASSHIADGCNEVVSRAGSLCSQYCSDKYPN